ncbi:hypothetical protein [Sorangium sp. So ce1078]
MTDLPSSGGASGSGAGSLGTGEPDPGDPDEQLSATKRPPRL